MTKRLPTHGLRLVLLVSAVLISPLAASAQSTLDGMERVADWTDLENSSGDMPSVVWGDCDVRRADRVGLRVDFDNGTSATAIYSNLADKWNTSHDTDEGFPGLIVGPATGFLASCPKLHYLFNDGIELPMAWDDSTMAFSGNFDLDYSEQNGSNFRADQSGWVSARFQTYCGAATASAAAAPAMSASALIALALLLTVAGMRSLKRTR